MIKRAYKNWLMYVFLSVIILGCLVTLCFSFRPIAAEIFSGVRAEVRDNGLGINTISTITSIAENAYTDNLYGKSYWVEILGAFNKMVGKSIFLDTEDRYTVYKMTNGQETWNYHEYDTTPLADKYRVFAEDMGQRDIPLFFVQAPFKIDKYNNTLPYGIKDEMNPLADNFLSLIAPYDTLDLREVIHDSGLDYKSLFYNTDHHWTPETGLWATNVISERLMSVIGIRLDTTFLSKEYYSFTAYNSFFLGSQGKRAGVIYSGLDDFVLIEPNYDTDYQLEIPSLNISKKGNYSDTILFKENLKQDLYNGDPGRVYTGDNYSLMTIQNLNATNNTKILLVKDSFSKTVIPFLASTCSELHVIDLRTFRGSVSEYAAEKNIDAAVVLYNPSVVVDPYFFEFY